MSAKTPVSVLEELSKKLSITPNYQDLQNSASPHAPCFLCEVTCLDFVAQGQGKSKKEAKHAAADKMLKILAVDAAVSSPYENKLKENAVGALTDYCDEYVLPNPDYKFVREEGPAHDKRFTERCYVGSFATETTERSKKQAKQVVALQMITLLKDIIEPRVKDDIRARFEDMNEDFQAALTKFRNCEIVFNTKFEKGDLSTPIVNDCLRYREYYTRFKEFIDEYTSLETENPEDKLSSLMEKMETKYSLLPVRSKDSKVCIVSLHIYLAPSLNVYHYGSSYVEASRNAAIKALRYIRILCVQPENESTESISEAEFHDLLNLKK